MEAESCCAWVVGKAHQHLSTGSDMWTGPWNTAGREMLSRRGQSGGTGGGLMTRDGAMGDRNGKLLSSLPQWCG